VNRRKRHEQRKRAMVKSTTDDTETNLEDIRSKEIITKNVYK